MRAQRPMDLWIVIILAMGVIIFLSREIDKLIERVEIIEQQILFPLPTNQQP